MTVGVFIPKNWYWIVGGDTSRAWSSAQSAYVTTYPSNATTRIGSEAELRAVLRGYGLAGPGADAVDVKAEAQRRIIAATGAADLQACLIKQLNALMRATELTNKKASGQVLTLAEATEAASLETLAATIKRIRSRSNDIEAMTPIPADYAADARWA